jgi:hypothetical protein
MYMDDKREGAIAALQETLLIRRACNIMKVSASTDAWQFGTRELPTKQLVSLFNTVTCSRTICLAC